MKGPASSAGAAGLALPVTSSGSRPGVQLARKALAAGPRASAKDFQGLLDAAGATPQDTAVAVASEAAPGGASKARGAALSAQERPARGRRPRAEQGDADVGAPALVAAAAAVRAIVAPAPRALAPPAGEAPTATQPARAESRSTARRPSAEAPSPHAPERRQDVAREPAVEATPRPTEPPVSPAAAAPPSTTAPELAPPAAVTGSAEPPRVVDASQTLLQLAMTDSSLSLDVNRQVVNVALNTEATGALELELRLRDGRAHVLVTGPSAPLVAQHAPALREVLAQQGLSLGDFSTSQQQRQPAEAPERDAASPSRTPASVTSPTRPRRHEGRIDVEA